MDKQQSESRREFVKKAVYVTPAILSLAVAPAYAKNGSPKALPPGQEKKVELPPGQEKKVELPPGQAKKIDL